MSNQIPQDKINEVLDAAPIVEIIGEDIALRKQGVNYIGLCPFHTDRTPSMVVSAKKGLFKCFACGEGGNIFTWFQKHHNMSYPEAVREVARICKIELPEIPLTPQQLTFQRERESIFVVLEETNRLFQANLSTNDKAKHYLEQRKINQDTAARFALGYALDYNGLSDSLLKQGYNKDYLLKSGVAYLNDKQKIKDGFWGRIMFPFFSKSGQIIAFTGRDISGSQAAKYKNSPETMLFKKEEHIFGLYQARNAIAKSEFVYVVEGQMDVLSLSQRGVENVVATSGTAFTDKHRKILHTQTTRLVMLFDGDAAGMNAAFKYIPQCVSSDFEVRCVRLPKGKDPDEIAQLHGDKIGTYLLKQTVSYVEFLSKNLFTPSDDVYARKDKTMQIIEVIARERNKQIRESFLRELSPSSGFSFEDLSQMSGDLKIPETPSSFEPGFYGLDFAAEYIDETLKELHLVKDFSRFQKLIGEEEPYAYYCGIPSLSQIQELSRQVGRVIFHSPLMEATPREESEDIRIMKELYVFGMTVDTISDLQETGFLYAYIKMYGDKIKIELPTPEVKNTYISRCAEMISYTTDAIRTVNIPTWADYLGLKLSALKEVLKPFLQERKSKNKIERELDDICEDVYTMETDRVPEYVEQSEEYSRMLRRYDFYPLLNKKQEPVCYMVRKNGGFQRVADFYMQPLFHVDSNDSNENRRVIRLNSLEHPGARYVEFPSKTFSKLSSLIEKLIEKGPYNFENGTATEYTKIWASMSHNFPLVNEIKVFGQQEEGCFLFANGILHEVEGIWKFEYADELGIMEHNKVLFYSPAFSKVNINIRKDADQYEQDRWLMYTETPPKKQISFAHWAELMNEVYQINDNGKWAIIYAMICAFRSDIYPINRLFTAIFFIGPTQSGKTQIAVSIRSLFIKPDAPAFNLNSGTNAAFFSVLERFRDVPLIMEEYNDEQIDKDKFQGLKAVTYDGDGKQKRKSATGNEIVTSKVNAPIILLGQEAAQRDDNSLSNRSVLCEVTKREEINTDSARVVFEELKNAEKSGLSYLLVEVLKLRTIVRSHFARLQKECAKDVHSLITDAENKNGDYTRVINTVSMFLAMCKLITVYAPHLPLPFTYEEFKLLAVDKIKKQVEMLTKTDKLAMFFNTIDFLIDKGSLLYGRDFKIDYPGKPISLKGGKDYQLPHPNTAVLYMNISNVHKLYAAAMTNQDNPLSLTTLEVNLNSHPAFIGVVKNTRFKWKVTEDVPIGGTYTDMEGRLVPNMALKKIIKPQEKQTSAMVLNYDVLKAVMGIDFERGERQEETKEPIQVKLPF